MPRIETWNGFLLPTAGALVGFIGGLAIRSILLPRLARLANATSSRIDDVIIAAVRRPVVLWAMLVGIQGGLSLAGYDSRASEWLHRALLAALILSVSWTAGFIAAEMLRTPGSSAGLPAARILSSAAKATVVVVGALVALQSIGVSVTPILTALGVGGLAVGLALQDTLANLFAGFHILVSRQVRPGDFVQLSTGEQGYVEDISWRNTTVRQLSNNIVIVPNAQLAKASTLNYSLPDAEQAVLVPVGVSYDEDLDRVESVTVDVAASVQAEVEGAVRGFEPFIRYHTFGESSIEFTVIMRAERFVDNYLMKHEFVKRLAERFTREGITIPYPQRVLHLPQPPVPPPE